GGWRRVASSRGSLFHHHQARVTRLAGDSDAHVFRRHPQPIGTLRTVHVDADFLKVRGVEIEDEAAVALLAGDRLAGVAGVDPQFTATMRAIQIKAARL